MIQRLLIKTLHESILDLNFDLFTSVVNLGQLRDLLKYRAQGFLNFLVIFKEFLFIVAFLYLEFEILLEVLLSLFKLMVQVINSDEFVSGDFWELAHFLHFLKLW